MQVLTSRSAARCVQHLPDVVGHDGHCPTLGAHGRHHACALAADSRLGRAARSRTDVATYHHQAVDQLPARLTATGWADDGTIEAFEVAGPAWAVGVQWHPEVYDGAATLFAGFVRPAPRGGDRASAGAR